MLEHTDWAELEHAYGPARDIPVRLVQLLNEDPEVQAGALGMLDMSVLHQESLYSATAPAALYVAAVSNDPRTMTVHEDFSVWDERPRPLRAALLEWLGMIAASAAYGETPLLAAAFPSGYDRETPLTRAQHRYLKALVERDMCWRYTHLITSWFDDIGLPPARDVLGALVAGSADARRSVVPR
ncbi:hypothetical protein [Streptomyces zaomyceticus]|uniref:hypothetical protein n=1 Tax=Streptomyces zaomyceticus TaxID=68286 RepID=UPI0037B485C7